MTATTRLTIHIGLHKTGSTAIQHYFWRHPDELLQHGIYYPATGRPGSAATQFGHHEIPWSFTGDASEPPQVLLDRLRAEILETTMQNVVVSSEEFGRMTRQSIATLAASLPFETRIVFYYRRQSEIVQGLYGTDVLYGGERRSLDAYADAFEGPLDFSALAAKWAEVYGKAAITALAYAPSAFPDRNIVPHFMAAMGLSGPSGEGETFQYNVSLPWYAVLAVLRLRSVHVSESAIARVVESFEIMFRHDRPKLALFSPGRANAFDQRFAGANERFVEEYAPGQPPISPFPLDGEEEYLQARLGLLPEIELTLRAVADHVRTVHETGEPPASEAA